MIRLDGRLPNERQEVQAFFPGPEGVVILQKRYDSIQAHAMLIRTTPRPNQPQNGFISCVCVNNQFLQQQIQQIIIQTNLISLESLCVKIGLEVYRLVVTITGMPDIPVDLGILGFLTAALHAGIPIRFVPNILHFQQVNSELYIDCIKEENPQGSFLLVLDDTCNILYTQQSGEMPLVEVMQLMDIQNLQNYPNIYKKLEDNVKNDIYKRQEEAKQRYKNLLASN